MSIIKKIRLIAVSTLLITLAGSLSFRPANAAGPNNGSNNPGVCKSQTNPKCSISPA